MEQKKPDFTGKSTITCLISGNIIKCTTLSNICQYFNSLGGRRRLNYTFEDKSEMVEEYDIKSHELLSRRMKKPSNFKETQWFYEVGEAPIKQDQELLLQKTNENPIFVRKDTARDFQFRIRNLKWPEEVYQVEVDEEKQQIIIKTTVKKYYKRFEIPDMARMGLELNKSKINFYYKNNTLVISYQKPDSILMKEQQLRNQFDSLNKKNPQEGDIEFVTQA